jgi:hypothetical protein
VRSQRLARFSRPVRHSHITPGLSTSGKEVTVKGTVTDYQWGNPHVMMGLDVQGANGKVERWKVGGPSTNRMAANGWDKTTLKPGDVITAMGYRFTDGQPVLRLQKIVMSSGKEMFLYGR